MNYDSVTIQDCEENYNYRGKETIIENGQVVGFLEPLEGEKSG